MAGEARRHGWRVVAFAFAEAPGLAQQADLTVPSRVNDAGAVLAAMQDERIGAVVFSGKFWMKDLLHERTDATLAKMKAAAGTMIDANIVQVVAATLGRMGIELLDQRPFLDDGLPEERVLGARTPTEAQWADVRRGLEVARAMAALSIGQTVVVRRGAVSAVEAIEGTTAAVRRGTALSGPGAVVVKTVAVDHDFRFDVPTVGPETIAAAAEGGAAVVALEAGRVFVLDLEASTRRADAAGIALVSARGAGG
jgi:DUF1009 family protein